MSGFPWDPENRYREGLLRQYEHWTLGIQFLQVTFGAYVILANRPGIERFSELEPAELTELVRVMRHMETALESNELFRPDRFNYEQLGNALHHLHFHGIPRYASPRHFAGRAWVDTAYGGPARWPDADLDDGLIREIRLAVEPHLPPL